MPVRLPVRAGWGARSSRAVLTRFCSPTAEPETLSSLSSWFQGPPRDALIGWGRRPRPRQSPREGEGSRGGSPVRAPPRPSWPPRTRTRTAPGSGGVSPRGEREGGAALLAGSGLPPSPLTRAAFRSRSRLTAVRPSSVLRSADSSDEAESADEEDPQGTQPLSAARGGERHCRRLAPGPCWAPREPTVLG